jgi:hypothetical protein
MTTLHIRQDALQDCKYPIRLTLKRPGQPDHEASAKIEFALSPQEQEDLRWYLEDYLQRADVTEAVVVQQVERVMKARGEELYKKVLAANHDTQALWFSIRNDLANLRVEISSGIAEAASIPWELMRDPQMDSPISLRVKSFVRAQSNPNISFVPVPPPENGRVRLLYIACRPGGPRDVELRAVANRLLQDLGPERSRFDIKALRPPTFEQLQKELADAKEAGRPYHIVHFDGHGIYADLGDSRLADWVTALSSVRLGGTNSGKHGYLLFEHPGEDKMRPVDGKTLGQLLHDAGTPILVLNACQSALHEASTAPKTADGVHEEVRAIGSLAQAVIDGGIPAVLGMRYSVYVVTAAQYIGQLYAALSKGRSFGQAATEARKHLYLNPERWLGLRAHPLRDWFVPVVYEASPVDLFPAGQSAAPSDQFELDPVQSNGRLLRYVPEGGFIGRDETLLALDRAFDEHRVVLLHAYAGQGKTSAAVEFARWYALTSGLGEQPLVFFASFEGHTDLNDILNQIGQFFSQVLESRGVHWPALNEAGKRLAEVKQLLREFPALWIWDNVEPVAGFPEGTDSQWTAAEQDDLRDFLKQINLDPGSKAKILLTSRRDEHSWLGGTPYRIAMPRMSHSDAAKLALKLGGEKGLKPSEIADWQSLLDYCAGNPLTLRILVGQAVREGLRGKEQIERFVGAIRSGEQEVEDADAEEGRDKSLGASLNYGFRNAFKDDELPIVALLHLFQGTAFADVLRFMGERDHALPEMKGKTKEYLTAVLMSAKEIGLLTQSGRACFQIHPALPWFLRQIFARHYDGKAGRSTAQAAVRAWVVATAVLGGECHKWFNEGNREVLATLKLEEPNLLHARRLARQNKWWGLLVNCMQGLDALYDYHGRLGEWARLVEEIRLDFVTENNEPVAGREEDYALVMSYLIDLARKLEHDHAKATALQRKCVEYEGQRCSSILSLEAHHRLTPQELNQVRDYAVSLSTLGSILCDQGNADCEACFKEAMRISQRIGDKNHEATCQFNLGTAYLEVRGLRNPDAAEQAYQQSLRLFAQNDTLNRCKCMRQIGGAHYVRLRDARQNGETTEAGLEHARRAADYYTEALRLCPSNAFGALATIHNGLGVLLAAVGDDEGALRHFEEEVQCEHNAGDRLGAGVARCSVAAMHGAQSSREPDPNRRRDKLLRARAYAEAALRDFQHYQGRAAADEAKAQGLIDRIDRDLANLSA